MGPMPIDSRTFRSVCRHFAEMSEAPLDIRWNFCQQDSRTAPDEPNVSDHFVVIAENWKGEFVVRRCVVERDLAEVYSDVTHVVRTGSAWTYTSDIDRAREAAMEACV